MRITRIHIKHFRGISEAKLILGCHTVLIGDNNSGKSTVLEAIDLVLGPDRIARAAPIDEHDFYAGSYLNADGQPIPIEIELVITDLTPEQSRHFRAHLEFWDTATSTVLDGPPIEAVDSPAVTEALRVGFHGWYEADDDDFKSETYFCHPAPDGHQQPKFGTADKRMCGFLLLRALRTGSRALSLERGSLLDIILRVRELRPKMWEKVLEQLRVVSVAEAPELGISEVLSNLQTAIREFVPADWASDPHLRVSDLTREHLRRTLTVFMATGAKNGEVPHAAPYQHQGTGTVNMLVLALLSMIAEAKKTVIFAMEEPETAIPPSTQKRIVGAVRSKSSQAIFTSHSPYVLEEFAPDEIMTFSRTNDGKLSGSPISFPAHIKPKAHRSEYRLRFAEALLARRVLITEGRTEYDAYPAAARRLSELDGQAHSSFEALGIAIFNADGDSQVANYGNFFRALGKTIFAVYDQQTNAVQKAAIEAAIDHCFEAPTHDFEEAVLNETAEISLRRFGAELIDSAEWPQHLSAIAPVPGRSLPEVRVALKKYFEWSKGAGSVADLLTQCSFDEMPAKVKMTVARIKSIVQPPPAAPPPAEGGHGEDE